MRRRRIRSLNKDKDVNVHINSRYARALEVERVRLGRPKPPPSQPPILLLPEKVFSKSDPKRSILVWINTYDRPSDLKNLLNDIYKNKESFTLKLMIIDDASPKSYDKMIESFSGKLNIEYHKMEKNHGKKGYWRLCNYAISEIKNNMNYDYYIKLDDDGRLVDGFFSRCVNLWESIRDPKKICLNFRLDSREGKIVWTGVKPKLVSYSGNSLYLSQWVDMDFFVNINFFAALRFRISKQHEARFVNPFSSSGVGRDISTRLHAAGYNLYLTTQSLVIHDEHDSKMNPGERERNPLLTKPLTDSRYGLKR